MSRSATAADVWQKDRGVVPGNLSTSIHRQILPMFTTWAHTAAPHIRRHREKILEDVDSQTNLSGKEIAVNQVEKMVEAWTMAEVQNEAGLWIDYRQNKQVLNDTMPSVLKDKTHLMP